MLLAKSSISLPIQENILVFVECFPTPMVLDGEFQMPRLHVRDLSFGFLRADGMGNRWERSGR